MKSEFSLKQLVLFFALAFIISWLLWLPSVMISNGINIPPATQIAGQFAIFGPAIAAVILLSKNEGKSGVGRLFKNAWNWRFKKVWLIPALFLPALLIGITLAVKLPVESRVFQLGETFAPIPLFAVILFFTGGPLEEFGWRGYALPRLLDKFTMPAAGLILGILHGLWHIPLHFMNGTVQSAMPIWEFIAVTAIGSIVYSWIFINTGGSLVPMLLHHWAGNFTAALFVYWDTSLGRWVFFVVQLLFVIVILLLNQIKNKRPSNRLNSTFS
jgi:membrane protease YdiL (CAAX protease family)